MVCGTSRSVSFQSTRICRRSSGVQKLKTPDRLTGIGRDRLQQTHQAASNRLDATAIEEVSAVFDSAFDSLGRYRLKRAVYSG